MNRLLPSNQIEAVIKNLPINKSPGLDGFTGEIYQTFIEEIACLLLKLVPKIKQKENFQTLFMKEALPCSTNQAKTSPKGRISDQYH